MTTSSPISGACLCGVVRFTIEPPYRAFQLCHCSRCRKATGSAHAANIFVPVAQFAWTAGQEQARRYEHAEAKAFCTGFCGVCGSRSLLANAVTQPTGRLRPPRPRATPGGTVSTSAGLPAADPARTRPVGPRAVNCQQAPSLPWVTRSGVLMIVPAGALDVDPGERPGRNVHFASRAPWYVHASELPFFDEG